MATILGAASIVGSGATVSTAAPSFKPAEAFAATAHAALLRRYNELKTRHDGGSWEDYEAEKNVFLRELLAKHGPRTAP